MRVFGRIHGTYVHTRRVAVLSRGLAELIPPNARVLDVGSGDGLLGSLIAKRRPDVAITGIDTLLRDSPQIPTGVFDGKVIPYPDASFDVAILVDVLHHAEDPTALLGEAERVSRQAILVKDHTVEGRLGGPTLRIMDWVGNARYGVSLPYTYWTEAKWLEAFESLGLRITSWRKHLGLYPRTVSWIFERSLHFVARLERGGSAGLARSGAADRDQAEARPRNLDGGEGASCTERWEAAYRRFETPQQETRKFAKRLLDLGAERWSRDAEIVELFCGRGNGLHALAGLGFTRLEGVDLSPTLLASYSGPARCYVCDCRTLPFPDLSKDILVIQGGLHHLPRLPEDLDQTLSEAHRVLRDDGLLIVVEPWLTPFLRLAHAVCRSRFARSLAPKVDALATMIQYEGETYTEWLARPRMILGVLRKYFKPQRNSFRWGKVRFAGLRRADLAGMKIRGVSDSQPVRQADLVERRRGDGLGTEEREAVKAEAAPAGSEPRAEAPESRKEGRVEAARNSS